jgi:hypothetical protein
MHVKLLQTSALLLQLVVETMIDAIISQKKWLNEALTTQKLHRNHIHPIKQSTDEPVLELLLKVAHADLEIRIKFPQHAENIESVICNRV